MRFRLALLSSLAVFSQESYYRFAVEQDAVAGAADFSFLNAPLTDADRVTVRDGHFVTAAGKRIRFFGVNLAFSANFPSAADAPRIAKRLRRLGVNLVRLHHMDTQPDANPSNAASLLTTGPYPTLNANSVRLLRGFLDALKAEGIYVNLNLKVGYEFRPAVDGVPLGRIPTQSKPLHIFEPRMVALQKEFTRRVIDSLALREDPVLAMVEINNESSLVYSYQANQLEANVIGDYRQEMQRQWNRFLRGRYASTGAVREAWGPSEEDSDSILNGNWQLEVHAGSAATLARLDGGAVQVNFTANQGRVIAKQVGFSVREGDGYQCEMEIRSESPVSVYWDVKQDVSPWRTQISRTFTTSAEWQRVTLPFSAAFAMDGIGRFGVQIERTTAPVMIRNARLIRRGRRGLAEGESLESENIALPAGESASLARTNDFIAFLAALDKSYLDTMLETVRESTEGRVPVAGTQMDFGGMLNIDTHAGLDYQDFHFYIDHYNFPAVAWDGRDWRIRDSSHLETGLGTLARIAAARPKGIPFTVSEFNQNWPNRRGQELLPPLSVFAAFQDWDGLMHFAYSHGRGWDAGVPNGFNLNGDWSKWITFGQSAFLFRTDAIRVPETAAQLPVSLEDRMRYTRERRNNNFSGFFNVDPAQLLRRRVELDSGGEGAVPEALRSRAEVPAVAETGEFLYHQDAKLFLLQAPMAAGLLGRWDGEMEAGPLRVESSGFRTILLTSLDGAPLETSRRMLLTNPGHTLRSRNAANPAEPQRVVNYPNTTDWFTVEPDPGGKPSGDLNGGVGPTWMSRTDAAITLRTQVRGLRVHVLDGGGRRIDELAVTEVEGGYRFALQADSPWFEITGEP